MTWSITCQRVSIPSHELAHIITTRSTALLIKCAYLQLREKKGGRVQFELMEINLNFKKKTRQYNIEEKYHPRSSLKSSLHLFLSTDNLLRRFKTPLSPPPHPFPWNELFPQYQHSISNIARANDINDVIIGEKRDDTFNDVTIIIDASSLSLSLPSSPSLLSFACHPSLHTTSNPRGIAGTDKQAGPPSEPSP